MAACGLSFIHDARGRAEDSRGRAISYELVISPGAIATAFNKDPQLIEFVLHKSFNGARFRIHGAERSQLVFDVDDVIRWASKNMPGSLNPQSIAALRQLAFPVPVNKEGAR